MKKLMVLVCAVVFLFGIVGFAQAHSNWAKYRTKPAPGNLASGHQNPDGTIRCCDCHGKIPGIPPAGCR